MMAERSARLVTTGAFVLGGLILFAVGLFMIGERRELFATKFTLYTEFERVTGLQPGAPVRVSGLTAGEVKDIHVPASPAQRFRVEVEVREKLHGLVRTDSVASIQTEGLVGGMYLMISTGTEQAPQAPAGSTIPSREPFDMADLLQQMSETITLVNQTVAQLRGDLETTVKTFLETTQHADALIESISPDITSMSKSGRLIAANMQAIIADVRAGRGTIGKLVNDDDLYKRAQTIAKQAEDAITNVKQASEEAKKALGSFNAKDGPVGTMSSDFRLTLSHAREALADLADDTEALKRNFLFRSYFTKRGYYDLDDISPAEYRQGVFEGKGQAPLRIWLDAGVIFTRAADGSETVSDGGRARLDSAMAPFLEYSRDNVLMIEGYAAGGSTDEEYVASRSRAALVREYLISKFTLKPQYVGVMPLGRVAPGSPANGTWNGVALALFVDRARMAVTGGH
jgi:phospholipid/cholesterol/gamma-HCH transport system substrate-binding protein